MRRMQRSHRFLAYGAAGWLSEILTTGVRSRGRDGERLHDRLDPP